MLLAAHSCPNLSPAGSTVQRSEKVTLDGAPFDVVCNAVGFFQHMKELKCTYITGPQQVCLAV